MLISPDDFSFFTRESFIAEGNRVREDDVPKALDLLITREATAYMNTWDLLTPRQRQVLMCLAEIKPSESPFRLEGLQRFGMSQPAVLMRALNSYFPNPAPVLIRIAVSTIRACYKSPASPPHADEGVDQGFSPVSIF
jgi:hypothetical protein